MYNLDVVNEIQNKTKGFLNELKNTGIKQEFKLGEIRVENREVKLGDAEFTGDAKNKLLNILKVKNNFPEYATRLTEAEWSTVIDKLKKANADSEWIAQIDDANRVTSLYGKKLNKKGDDDVSLQWAVDQICEELGQSAVGYELSNMGFHKEKQKIDIVLLNQEDDIDVFGNGLDKWKIGNSFTFNPFEFGVGPFFERLSCANGMRSKELGFNSKISQGSFNIEKIRKHITNAFDPDAKRHHELIQMTANHLQDNNISIQEFFDFKKFLGPKDDEDIVKQDLVYKYFNDGPFYGAYGENIQKKSRKWRATANTGINAYDFFNLLTWIASHPEETKLQHNEIIDLQIKAGNFFFKKEFDLEDIAVSKEVKYEMPKEAQ